LDSNRPVPPKKPWLPPKPFTAAIARSHASIRLWHEEIPSRLRLPGWGQRRRTANANRSEKHSRYDRWAHHPADNFDSSNQVSPTALVVDQDFVFMLVGQVSIER